MSEDQQAAERRRRGLPPGIDPRNYGRAIDPATRERMLRAQAVARAQAQAATTVLIATVVSLITSAFSFVAALAWNDAIHGFLQSSVSNSFAGLHLDDTAKNFIYAIIVTIIAVIVVVALQRIASRIAKQSAIDAATAEEGSL